MDIRKMSYEEIEALNQNIPRKVERSGELILMDGRIADITEIHELNAQLEMF